jgi:hypothetical protein
VYLSKPLKKEMHIKLEIIIPMGILSYRDTVMIVKVIALKSDNPIFVYLIQSIIS